MKMRTKAERLDCYKSLFNWKQVLGLDPPDFAEAIAPDVILLGRHAKAALANPAFDAAFKKIEAEFIKAWKTSTPSESEAREKIYYRMEGLAQVKLKLQGMLANMEMELSARERNKPGQS